MGEKCTSGTERSFFECASLFFSSLEDLQCLLSLHGRRST